MGQIVVNGLGKAYKVYSSRGARLADWLLPIKKHRYNLKWVFNEISFVVNPGEALGIIGINGAGKSTLLKLIAGTVQPTVGSVSVTGRVAALLELGMGFHPDFTGRQNVIMAGQLMGLALGDIEAAMPEIEAFAEIGDYIDQPVRVYSSGMQMRLAFSVATAWRPDVLIVDEALSVGDAYFQHKSFERIKSFRKQGTTLLIVSHDKSAIQSICDRAVLLNAGAVEKIGPPEEIMDLYNALIAEKENQTVRQESLSDGRVRTISGTGDAVVKEITLLNKEGKPCEVLDVGAPVFLRVLVEVIRPIPRLVLGYMIKDRLGQVIYGTNTHIKESVVSDVVSGECIEYTFSFDLNLGPGSYSVATALVSSDTHMDHNYEWRDLALVFTVVNFSHEHFAGNNWMDPELEVRRA